MAPSMITMILFTLLFITTFSQVIEEDATAANEVEGEEGEKSILGLLLAGAGAALYCGRVCDNTVNCDRGRCILCPKCLK